ncbi:MAG: ankyrin repeat domain-containing protein [Saprospiraceae bacterium]|nr:ankyrin repeat domain-containing protein [Saprospiraceae bacterium]
MSGGDWKAFFKGVQDGDIELVGYYLRMGIDPNYQHPEEMTSPLLESIRKNHIDIAKLLLDNGADPSIRGVMEGKNPREVAEGLGNGAALDLLAHYE